MEQIFLENVNLFDSAEKKSRLRIQSKQIFYVQMLEIMFKHDSVIIAVI